MSYIFSINVVRYALRDTCDARPALFVRVQEVT